MVASFRKKSFKFWSSSLPPYVHMVGEKGKWTFATVKCLLLVVIWQFFLCGLNFSCSWRQCIQISQIRIWSVRNDATSDNWVLPIIKCPPVFTDFYNDILQWYIYLFAPITVRDSTYGFVRLSDPLPRTGENEMLNIKYVSNWHFKKCNSGQPWWWINLRNKSQVHSTKWDRSWNACNWSSTVDNGSFETIYIVPILRMLYDILEDDHIDNNLHW